MNRIPLPSPPAIDQLPPKQSRSCVGGNQLQTIVLKLKTITPILGGSATARKLDDDLPIRGATIRGHLRFWWRAVYGHKYEKPQALADAEQTLWGSAGEDCGGRSPVQLKIDILRQAPKDQDNIQFSDAGSYALWPAREQRERGQIIQPAAPRWKPNLQFQLTLSVPKDNATEVCNAIRAWILFGGYGSRTRRGCGSLDLIEVTVDNESQTRLQWLPNELSRKELNRLFGFDLWVEITKAPSRDLPQLHGAIISYGDSNPNAEKCWHKAINWLKDFRQAQASTRTHADSDFARVYGQDNRPGRSNWPEADKVRQLSNLPPQATAWAHPPRHNNRPVWPRAAFGLPIISQFQMTSRNTVLDPKAKNGKRYLKWKELTPPVDEPREGKNSFEIHWFKGNESCDRLGSPLIVKAMPLVNGNYYPLALWLYRSYPQGGTVGLKSGDPRSNRSKAEFDLLVAAGDKALFTPLDIGNKEPQGLRMRTAFMHWLETKKGAKPMS